MIEITATVASMTQAEQLLQVGIDTLYFGNATYGLRLPHSFSIEEMQTLTHMAHQKGKKVTVAVNAIMHEEHMAHIRTYLHQLEAMQVDAIEIGDAGVLWAMHEEKITIPVIYNTQMTMTNAKQINFWGKRGAIGAVLGREVPFEEMKTLSTHLNDHLFAEVLVYGASCIHQSKRPLISNYYQYIQTDETDTSKDRGLFISEPKKPDTHYSIFEDEHGTHIFANNDIDLIQRTADLDRYHFDHWKLDGLFVDEADFIAIAALFVKAKQALLDGTWTMTQALKWDEQVRSYHPAQRGLDEGFFHYHPDEVK